MKRLTCGLFICVIACFLNGCDVSKLIDQYFASFSLNRLATARTDIAPGALITSNKNGNFYYGNINKFIANKPDQFSATNVDQDSLSQFQAVLPQYTGSTAIDGSLVLKVLDSILPVNLSSSLKLNGQVSIDQIQADGLRLEPADLEAFINSEKGGSIRQWLQGQWDAPEDNVIYIGYETYSAKNLKITSSNNTDISGDLSVNQTKVVQNGEIKVDVTKSSSTSLDLSNGGTSYVFAVKTGMIQPRGGGWRFVTTSPAKGIVKGKPEVHAVPVVDQGALYLSSPSQ